MIDLDLAGKIATIGASTITAGGVIFGAVRVWPWMRRQGELAEDNRNLSRENESLRDTQVLSAQTIEILREANDGLREENDALRNQLRRDLDALNEKMERMQHKLSVATLYIADLIRCARTKKSIPPIPVELTEDVVAAASEHPDIVDGG